MCSHTHKKQTSDAGSAEPEVMKGWTLKSCAYRLACGGVVLGFLQFVIGMGLPSWKRDSETSSGLWQTCTTTMESCRTYTPQTKEVWMDAVRALEVLALASYFGSLVIMCELNCNSRHLHAVKCDSYGLPSLCICTGVMGLSGATVFAVYETDDHTTFSSGLYLACVGSVFALLCGVQLLCFSHDVFIVDLDWTDTQQSAVRYNPDNTVFFIPRSLRATDNDVLY